MSFGSFPDPDVPRDDALVTSPLVQKAEHEELAEVQSDPTSSHPGIFDDIHRETKDILCFPYLCFGGFRAVYINALSAGAQINHSLNLSPRGSAYHFNPVFVNLLDGPRQQASDVFVVDTSTQGAVVGQYTHNFHKAESQWAQFKLISQALKSKWQETSIDTHYNGADFTVNLKTALSHSGILAGSISYLQKLSKNLSLGADLQLHREQKVNMTGVSLGGRYRGVDSSFGLTLSPMAATASYYHQLKNRKIQLGAELSVPLAGPGAPTTSFCYQYSFSAGSKVYGQISTKGIVAAVWEQPIFPMLSMTLSGLLNHAESASEFGFGFNLAL